ncbi:MAG: hypothetical protein F6K36_29645 [Symploca sp. SIO3C6]|nr:hypothetical protein [Symploca sp. SIO3C6]
MHQVLRIEKRKGGAIAQICHHIDRTNPPENADPNKRYLNRELLNNGSEGGEQSDGKLEPNTVLNYDQVKEKIEAIIAQCPRKIRGDQVRCVELMLSASNEYFRPDGSGLMPGEWDQIRLEDWLEATLDFINNELGERAISATLHVDELTPHLHVLVVPIEDWEKKNLSAKELFGSRQKLREWHDKYHRYTAPLGLARGERGSDAIHTTPREYRNHHQKLDVREAELEALGADISQKNTLLTQRESAVDDRQRELDKREQERQQRLEKQRQILAAEFAQQQQLQAQLQAQLASLEAREQALAERKKRMEAQEQIRLEWMQNAWARDIVSTSLDMRRKYAKTRLSKLVPQGYKRLENAEGKIALIALEPEGDRPILYSNNGTITPALTIREDDAIAFEQWARQRGAVVITRPNNRPTTTGQER